MKSMDPTSKQPSQSSEPSKRSDSDDFEAIRPGMEAASPEDAQNEADRRARIEYLRSLTGNHKKPKPWLKLLKVLVVLIVVAGLAGGVFWYFSKAGEKHQNQQQTAQKSSTDNSAATETVATKQYDSTNFNLSFSYPENWKVNESNGRIMVSSPAAAFKTSSGTAQAQIVFTIQGKQSTLPNFKTGNGLATRTSEKVAYAKPTPNQRAQTYLTFMSNAGTATGGLDVLFVTGDLGYQKDQDIPQKDIIQGDPLVSFYFAKCDNGNCPTDPSTAKVAIADSSWVETNALVKAAKAMLLSLSIN